MLFVENVQMIVEMRRYSGEIERHRHDYHQVILPVAGSLEIETERRSGRVTGSIGSFVPAGCNHTFVAGRADEFIVLDVPARCGMDVLDHEDVRPFFAIGPDMRGLIDYMAAVGAPGRLSVSLREAWSRLLLDRIAGQLPVPERTELAVRQAIAFMKGSLAEPIRIADIARAAGMSETRLHDAFLKRRAITPHAQLVALRLDAAERLLADPCLSIAEVAFRTGYTDQSALTRAMRRERGSTPNEVRRSLREHSGGKA